MRRCPQCQFIYPDTDRVCDFDQTLLVDASESEIAAITNTLERPALSELAATHSKNFERRRNKRALPLAAALGLALGIAIVVAYFAVYRQMRSPAVQERVRTVEQATVASLPSPSTSPSVVESPAPETATAEKQSSPGSKTTTAHTTTSVGPVSTSTPGTTSKSNGKQVILLNGGGKIEADEVWRTKDGIWYRRNGLVTLLKKNRVKAIVNQ